MKLIDAQKIEKQIAELQKTNNRYKDARTPFIAYMNLFRCNMNKKRSWEEQILLDELKSDLDSVIEYNAKITADYFAILKVNSNETKQIV